MRNEETKNRTVTGPMQIVIEELLIRCHPLEQRTMIICVGQQSMNLFQDPQNCNKGLISLYHFFCFFFSQPLLLLLQLEHFLCYSILSVYF